VLVPALFDALVDELFDRLATKGIVDPGCRRGPPAELAASLSGMDPPALARVRDAVRMELGPSFRTVVIGGAAASPAWADVLTAVGIDLDLGYGLTEAGPVVALGRAAECPPGSVGRPLPGVRVRIADDGEVLVSSDAIMQGYAGDASATARAFEGRWLRTGDRGRLDDDGFLFITGRLKDAMVTSSGETIYPDEIEPWYSSPLFAELAVVPLPGPDGNDRPVLVVVPSDPSSGIVTMKRAMAALRAAAPARLRVAGVVSRAEPLPRTAVGKIRRQALAAGCQAHEVCS
jgi:long-chain acyl-CoA synthetase